MDPVTNYIRSASGSLIKINRNLKKMADIVSQMSYPKQTKAKTQKELYEKLSESVSEMAKVARQTDELSEYVHGSAREPVNEPTER
jgi:methyl-accepting chemotaxis protein